MLGYMELVNRELRPKASCVCLFVANLAQQLGLGLYVIISELHISNMASSRKGPASSSNRASGFRGQEGDKLERDLIRLTEAEKGAQGKVAFWEQQAGRLGEQVARTRASLEDQLGLERQRKEEVAKAQRRLTLCQGVLGKQEADLATMEGQLKVNQEA